MRALLKKILPEFVFSIYRALKRRRRKQERERLMHSGQALNLHSLEDQIRNCGVKTGDVLMLHSSLSSLGYVEGGADSVIRAFLNALGAEGTLMMPSFPASGFNYDYLKSDPVFDVSNTPSRMGIISERFRKMPGVKRSFHPTDPVCALGPDAEYLTSTHFGQLTPYNAMSPFYKLCGRRGKILMLGTDLNSLTNLHTLEDAVENFRYPVYHAQIFDCRMRDVSGKAQSMKTKCHDPHWSRKRRCNALIPHFRQAGFLGEFKVGSAPVMLIDAKAMHEWMLKSYKEKGITMYTPEGN